MNKETALATTAVLAILAAVSALFWSNREPKIELNPYQALGAIAAEETLKIIGDKTQIILVAQDTSTLQLPALESQIKAFETSARKRKNLTVEREKVSMDPMMMMTTGGRLPGEQFLNLLRKYPKAGAIVLFLGFPQLSNAQLDGIRQTAPDIVVAAGYRPDYRPLLQSRLIDLAIVPRFDSVTEPSKKPESLRDWFEQEYVILRPEDIAATPP